MVFAYKPQRGGRSIKTNTSTPPQDPPPPKQSIIQSSRFRRFTRKVLLIFRRK